MLREMIEAWPFFRARLSMLEMVFAKSDHTLSAHYDQLLVESALSSVGARLRDQLQEDIDTLLAIIGVRSCSRMTRGGNNPLGYAISIPRRSICSRQSFCGGRERIITPRYSKR